MLTKKATADGRVRVRFSLPADVEATSVSLWGDFDGWRSGTTMKRVKSGEWRASKTLDPGRTYHFRYLVDDERWENDWEADGYEANPYGTDDSLVSV